MDLRTQFIRWYFDDFHSEPLFKDMQATSENSPYHRENDIGVHTDMVVAQYIGMAESTWTTYDLCGALAAAFHDVGKPDACKINGIKYKPERGNYLSFGGHEIISARLWEDYAVRNWDRFKEMKLQPDDIYRIGWMIEHHLPWGVKKPEKRSAMAQTLTDLDLNNEFINFIKADTWGRISDDGPEKKQKVNDWIDEFAQQFLFNRVESPSLKDNQPILYIPIGASGSGKSSYRKIVEEDSQNVVFFSLDDLRMEWYVAPDCPDQSLSPADEYALAFERSCQDKQFASKANSRFVDMLKTGNDVYVDNTNTSAKRRRFFITEARRRGYFIQAIVFPIALQELIDRQTSRPDKNVPEEAVKRQYMGLQLPSYGDFDHVTVVDFNFQ